MFELARIVFHVVFFSSLGYIELYRILDIICFIIFYNKDNNEKNRIILAKKMSSLGIIVVKLSQWLHSFLKIKYEDTKNFDLIIDTLPLLQADCQQEKNTKLHEYVNRYKDILDLDSLDSEIYKSASIGQIYRCKLQTGEKVIVKIKNKEVLKNITKWEQFLKEIINYLDININIEHFFLNLRDQINFIQEAENLKAFEKKYRKNKLVDIPKLYAFDEDIIIMSYLHGESFLQVKSELSVDEREYYVMLSKLFYQQSVFIDDLVHMDLHSNNWAINRENKSIVIYDFGWVLKENEDFKKFFLLCHIDSKKTLNFFLKRYSLDSNKKVTDYVHKMVTEKEIDVFTGLKLIIKLFPNHLIMDDFLFSVLSITIFINSLMEKLDSDLDEQIVNEIEFIDKYESFIQLGTLLKYSKKDQTKSFLSRWYEEIYEEKKK